MRRRHAIVLAALALLVGCPGPRGAAPGSRHVAQSADGGTGDAANEDALVAFARAHRAEVDRLSVPANHFVAHEQSKPRGFVSLESGRRPPPHVHHARMFAFGYGADSACNETVVEKDGTICEGAVYPGAYLTPEQTARATELMRVALESPSGTQEGSWRLRPIVRCFDPHHSVVLFDDRGVPAAEIVLCFECGNLRLTPGPGPDSEAVMTDVEARFFADTCRALDVGGCPPPGTSRMPDLPPLPEDAPRRALDSWKQQELLRVEALGRPHGINESLRLADLAAVDRKLWCAWLANARRGVLGGFECQDGRVMLLEEPETCAKPVAQSCEATVGDLVSCTRARLGEMCRVDPPACAKTDACKKGVVLRNKR